MPLSLRFIVEYEKSNMLLQQKAISNNTVQRNMIYSDLYRGHYYPFVYCMNDLFLF